MNLEQKLEHYIKSIISAIDTDLQLIPFAKESFENDADSPIGSFIREIKKTGKVIYSNGKQTNQVIAFKINV